MLRHSMHKDVRLTGFGSTIDCSAQAFTVFTLSRVVLTHHDIQYLGALSWRSMGSG
jgi:hypothetical protein